MSRTHCSPVVAEMRRAHKLKPNFTELARELSVTPQHVSRVFRGLKTSKRVMKALEKKILQMQRKSERGERAA